MSGRRKPKELYPIQSDDGSLCYTAIAVYAMYRIPRWVRDALYGARLWEDLLQVALLVAVEAKRHGLDDFRSVYNLAQREYYRFLRASGFRRPTKSRTYVIDEIVQSDLVDDGDEDEKDVGIMS